jgi:hypothetical protein
LLDRKDVFNTLIDNWKKTTNPVGLKTAEFTAWSEGLNLPSDTGTILYTGGLYQMVPFINAFVAGLDRLESTSVGGAGFKVFRSLSLSVCARTERLMDRQTDRPTDRSTNQRNVRIVTSSPVSC